MRNSQPDECKQDEANRYSADRQSLSHSPFIMVRNNTSEDNTKKSKLLFIDGLNIADQFFDRNGNHWLVHEAVNGINKFIKAATKSGWELKVFIGAATKSKEATKTWEERREAEVRDGIRNIAQGMNTLLGDAFRENGVEVFYSVGADIDDTLASYANEHQAAILSNSHHYFWYKGFTCPVYGKFEMKNDILKLIELNKNLKTSPKRTLKIPPPVVMDRDPALVRLSDNMYKRGAPSALVRRLGNIHVDCRPLRQALYARKGIKKPMLEIFPVWQNNQVVWLKQKVLPDDKLDHLLDEPSKAVEELFPKKSLVKPDGVSTKDWHNHLYAITAVVYELCAVGSKKETSFLQMLLPATFKFIEENKHGSQKAHKVDEVEMGVASNNKTVYENTGDKQLGDQ